MMPEVNSVCAFTFTQRFSLLNGVYRTKAETTFRDAVNSGVDIVANLYTPAGLSHQDYLADYNGYTSDRIVLLESVVDKDVHYYVPESVIATVPDPTVKEYFSLNLTINLGVYENAQVIYATLDHLKQIAQGSLGIESPLLLTTNPNNKVYLTGVQYEALDAARKAKAVRLSPLTTQLEQANQKITFLEAKIAAYEDLIRRSSVAAT